MQFSAEGFQATVQFLETHPESLRIKKVIFCLCKRYWENDESILSHFSLAELMEEIMEKIPDFPELEVAIKKLISSLNNSIFYAKISEIILDKLSSLYNSQDLPLSGIPTQPNCQQHDFGFVLDLIVKDLANHQEKKRIKKLILSAYQSQWEKDSGIIRKHDLRDLVLELYKLNPQKSDLEKSLYKIVQKLNKPEIYSQLSDLIVDRLAVLYEIEQKSAVATPVLQSEKSTLEIQNIKIDNPNYSSRDLTHIKKKINLSELAKSITNPRAEEIPVELPKAPASLSERGSPQKNYDLFELRLEIMQYTNPLRSKMILFSIFNELWIESKPDWSILKDFTLDYLLEQVLQMGKSKSEMQDEFNQISHLLPVLNDNEQTAKTLFDIIEALI